MPNPLPLGFMVESGSNGTPPPEQDGPDFDKDFSESGDFDKDFAEPSMKGSVSDYLFSRTAPGRIMSAFGQGMEQGWGADNLDLDEEVKKGLNKLGLAKDFLETHKETAKSVNEAFIRPSLYPLSRLVSGAARAPMAILQGIGEATGQTGVELEKGAKDQDQFIKDHGLIAPLSSLEDKVLGEAGDILKNIPSGYLPESNLIHTVTQARSVGAIGEGEEGYFNTKKPSPEAQEARQTAAQEAGTTIPPKPEPPVTDVHSLARQIDPDTFKEWDRLQDLQENLRLSREYLQGRLGAGYKEDLETQSKLDEIPGRLQETDEALRDLHPKTADARTRVQELLDSDSPEAEAYRKMVQSQIFENHLKMEDLKPKVEDAYTHANSLIPEKENAITKPDSKDSTSPSTPTPPEKATQPDAYIDSVKETTEKGTGGSLRTVKGTGNLKARGLSESVEADALHRGLTETFGDLPEYRQVKWEDQTKKVAELMNNDPQRAEDIAMGKKRPPEGILPESVFTAIRAKARSEGDINMLRRLATESHLTTEATTMGQRLAALGQIDSTDPVAAIKIVQDARAAKLKIKGDALKAESERIRQGIKTTLERQNVDPRDFETFINGIVCK